MSRNAEILSTPFAAEIRGRNGKIQTREMNVRVIQVKSDSSPRQATRQKPVQTIDRANTTTTDQGQKTSNITPLSDQWLGKEQEIIEAPYDQFSLVVLEEESNILRECIDAMVTNIEGFGHTYRMRKIPEEIKEANSSAIGKERVALENWLDVLCPEIGFVETRRRMRRDLELTGNAYWEVVRDRSGEIIEINHVPSYKMRLTRIDDDFTSYSVPVIQPTEKYSIGKVERRKRFRRYVQLDNFSQKSVYFKEYLDPRSIDKNTGEVGTDLAVADEATEMIHFKIYSARSVYGIPRYISRYVSVIGSRRAEEVNFFTLSNNYVPSMFIMVENGSLTGASVERLTELIESQVGSDPNYSKVVILEAESSEETYPGQVTTTKLNIHEPESQKTDQMFQDYDLNNQNKVRQAWRLPPLVIGRSDDYTRATAVSSLRVADEQVFGPARSMVDRLMVRLMLDQQYQWHVFKSRTPNITDNEVLTKAMVASEKSGAMTPRRADTLMEDIFEGDLGPMPVGIDIDTPYSLQFAQAQNSQRPPDQLDADPVERSEQKTWVDDYVAEILRGSSESE
jgi:PBSX family phage portal protein